MDYIDIKLSPNPRGKANPISKLFFLWIVPMFQKGYKKDLEYTDLYAVVRGDNAQELGDNLEVAWKAELQKSKDADKKPRFYKALVNVFWKKMFFATMIYCIDAWIIQVSQPIFLRLLIQSVNNDEKDSFNSYLYAGGICLSTALHALFMHPTVFTLFHMAMQCRVSSSALIYRKALKLNKASQDDATVGKLINLLSNDVNRFDIGLNFCPFIVTGPIQLLIFIYFLWDAVGPSSLTAVAIIVLLLPLQYYAGRYSAKYRLSIAKRCDERGRIMNEIIVGMRVIKMYAWEKPFSLLIDGIRKLEVKELKKRGILRGILLAMVHLGPKLVSYCTFVVYVLAGNQMSSEKVFFTLTALYTVVQIMVHFMPQATSGLGEIIVALNRIEEFLMLEEQSSNKIEHASIDSSPSIKLSSVSARWSSDRPTLENINVEVGGDNLLMVVGSVGSGKTSFLHTLIGELQLSKGNISINGTSSYASQEPWIFAGNLRQNILFGQTFDSKRYHETIRACALEEDLHQLPYGDMTIVGERGVALSGGQKARVNLARALYRKAEIYLMDDPLSAVDTKVSRHLFEKCILGSHLKGSLKVLVTHQLQYLPQANHIIVLDQGKVLAQGTYQELISQGIDFVSLMASESEDDMDQKDVVVKDEKKQEDKVKDISKQDDRSEKMVAGSVTAKTYWEYFKTARSSVGFAFLLSVFFFTQVLLSGNDYWLSFWANAEDRTYDISTNLTGCYNSDGQMQMDKRCDDNYLGRDTYLLVYSGFIISSVSFCLIRALYFYIFCTKISTNLHDWMFRSLVRAPTKFFDDNPSGRIMNRFSKDMGSIDELLPSAFAESSTIFLNMIGVITVVIISNYFLCVPTALLFVALYMIRRYFVQTARDLKRIEALTRSPLFTHIAATMQGITTIRASKTQGILIQQFGYLEDMHSSAWFLFIAANRWFGVWLELISCVFLVFVSFSFLTISSSTSGGNIGLAISSVLTLMGSFQWGMRQSAETENFMTSVERAFEYAKLKPEAPLESKPENKPPKDWPNGGEIKFDNVSLTYDEKPVLKNLTFEIGARNKIGIVGRTGAGKSSIIAALFRMTEPSGNLHIDGIEITEIGLHDLRKSISIIPQDPVLFSGTMRYNLDPFGQYPDVDLWNALEDVELKNAVPDLDYKVADGGNNFSVGQRQLVCLARAILRNNKIIVMDEATANVDPKTDSLIQKTIRSKFRDCTIITIAHRLHSVIDCDKILVLDNGYLKEFDHPHTLLQNPHGVFTSMVVQTGKNSEMMLRKVTEEVYCGRRASFSKKIPLLTGAQLKSPNLIR